MANPNGYIQFSEIKILNKTRININKIIFWCILTNVFFIITIGILHYFMFKQRKLVKNFLNKKFKTKDDIEKYIKWNNDIENEKYNKYNFKQKLTFWIKVI